MGELVLRRLLWAVPTLALISIISFVIIQLPPGDFLTAYVAQQEQMGETVGEEQLARMREKYNLDGGLVTQYGNWVSGLLRGDLGWSMAYDRPVSELLGQRMFLTITLSLLTLGMIWMLSLPIGIYSAVYQYSLTDYLVTFVGFIGLAMPNFLLAILVMYVGQEWLGISAAGLFSPEYVSAPWSLGRVGDLLAHIWIPVFVIGMTGLAGMIRVMRGNLLDELKKPYVVTARAKGVPPWRLLIKYPVRLAINPMISTIGWLLPGIVSGSVIVAIVLNLPTTGPLLLEALMNQDMYLAGSILMILSTLTVMGTLLSDILLAILDPRIRFGGRS